jgi:hypothetical protein
MGKYGGRDELSARGLLYDVIRKGDARDLVVGKFLVVESASWELHIYIATAHFDSPLSTWLSTGSVALSALQSQVRILAELTLSAFQ